MLHTCWKYVQRHLWPDLLFGAVVLFALLACMLLAVLHTWQVGAGSGTAHSPFLLTVMAPAPSPVPFFGPVIDAVTRFYQDVTGWLGRQGSLLVFTDPAATYDSPAVKDVWAVVLFVADSLLAIAIVLAGYQVIVGGFGVRYSQALEILPGLIGAGVGANLSLKFAQFWIDANNALCAVLLTLTTNKPLPLLPLAVLFGADEEIIFPLLAILLILLVILGIQAIVRLSVLLFLMVCLPMLFVLLAHSATRRIGQAGISGYVAVAMMQVFQLLALTVGVKVLLPFLSLNFDAASGLAPFASVLSGIGLLWMTLRIPGMLRNWALQPVADSSQAIGKLLTGALVSMIFL